MLMTLFIARIEIAFNSLIAVIRTATVAAIELDGTANLKFRKRTANSLIALATEV
jgi:hypothetical protein